MPDLTGKVLGKRYQVEAFIGRGGMADVYRVWDRQRAVSLALKILHEDLAEDVVFLRRFKREAQTLSKLQHPHIVRFYGLEEADELAFMLMDYVDGSTLRKEIARQKGALPLERVLEVLRPVCAALHYAHQLGIAHCDVKPGNIMIHKNGTVLVADFGIARLTGAVTTMTMVGAGTPAYMAPEQVRGETPTPQTDIYALGIVLYEMLTGGERPFTGEMATTTGSTGEKVRWEQVNLKPLSPRRFNPAISGELETVVLRCLEKEPARRFGSALELLQAVEAAIAKPPSIVPPAVPIEEAVTELPELPSEPGLVGEAPKKLVQPVVPMPPALDPIFTPEDGIPEDHHARNAPAWRYIPILIVVILLLVGGGRLAQRSQQATMVEAPVAVSLPSPTWTAAPTATTMNSPTKTALPTKTATRVPLTPTYTPTLNPYIIQPSNARQVHELAQLGKGTINQVAWSPDGKLLAVASSIGVYLYDAQTFEEVLFIGTDVRVDCVTFSPDGTIIAGGGTDIKLWHVNDGRLTLTITKGWVHSIAFSPDGKLLASGMSGDNVQLWSIPDGSLLHTLEGHTGDVNSVAFSPDGDLLASGSDDGTVRLWRVSDGSLLNTLEGHTIWVNSVAFSPDGSFVASGSGDDTIRLWQVSGGKQVGILEGHESGVTSVAYSRDGKTLASGSWDDTIRLWRISDESLLLTIEGYASTESIAYSPDGKMLASGDSDNIMRLWQVSDGSLLRTLEGHTDAVRSVAFSPDGRILASGSYDGIVRLWQVSDNSLLRRMEGHFCDSNVIISPDGKILAAVSGPCGIRIWGVSGGILLNRLKDYFYIGDIAFSPDGTLLVVGGDDLSLWRVSDWELLRSRDVQSDGFASVTFSPDGTVLATGMDSGAIFLWRVSDGGLLNTIEGHDGSIQGLAFSPDGTMLASESGEVKIWRISDGSLLRTIEGPFGEVSSVAFSPDGMLLASVSDEAVILWQVSDGTVLSILEEHTKSVWCVDFSPDGTLLASGSVDGTIRLWGISR